MCDAHSDAPRNRGRGSFNSHELLNLLRTPRKSGELLVSPSCRAGTFDSHAVDCPFLFYHDGCFWMTYIGWDGVGYQTGLARSEDLWMWEKQGLMLGRGPKGSVTQFNAALTCIMRDNELFGSGTLKQVNGRFVGTYHAYPKRGYEAGPGVIGLCYSDDLRMWQVTDPVLEPHGFSGWEAGGLYKSWLMEFDGVYYLFYNARDKKDKSAGPWVEEIGIAISTDLVAWERHPDNPVLKVGAKGDFDDRFAADPCVLRHGDMWVMFYYGNCSDGHARDGFAFSDDLLHWHKGGQVLLDVGPAGSIDAKHAHKPGIISKDRRLYHFYGAVAPSEDRSLGDIVLNEVRGIAVAASDPSTAQIQSHLREPTTE